MRQYASQTLYTYWNELRGDRIAPRRFDIEPSRLGTILAETFILECDAGQPATFRLAGTRVCDSFGREFRGSAFVDLFRDDDKAAVGARLDEARDHGAVEVLEAGAAIDGGRSVRFEIVLLPLVHHADTISRVLGSITAIDPPQWLGTRRLPPLDLLRQECHWPEGRPHAVAVKFREPPVIDPLLAGARLVRVNRRSFRILDGGLHKA